MTDFSAMTHDEIYAAVVTTSDSSELQIAAQMLQALHQQLGTSLTELQTMLDSVKDTWADPNGDRFRAQVTNTIEYTRSLSETHVVSASSSITQVMNASATKLATTSSSMPEPPAVPLATQKQNFNTRIQQNDGAMNMGLAQQSHQISQAEAADAHAVALAKALAGEYQNQTAIMNTPPPAPTPPSGSNGGSTPSAGPTAATPHIAAVSTGSTGATFALAPVTTHPGSNPTIAWENPGSLVPHQPPVVDNETGRIPDPGSTSVSPTIGALPSTSLGADVSLGSTGGSGGLNSAAALAAAALAGGALAARGLAARTSAAQNLAAANSARSAAALQEAEAALNAQRRGLLATGQQASLGSAERSLLSAEQRAMLSSREQSALSQERAALQAEQRAAGGMRSTVPGQIGGRGMGAGARGFGAGSRSGAGAGEGDESLARRRAMTSLSVEEEEAAARQGQGRYSRTGAYEAEEAVQSRRPTMTAAELAEKDAAAQRGRGSAGVEEEGAATSTGRRGLGGWLGRRAGARSASAAAEEEESTGRSRGRGSAFHPNGVIGQDADRVTWLREDRDLYGPDDGLRGVVKD